jgi:hypothetical protein
MTIQDVVNGYTEALLWANTYHYVVPSDDDSMDAELMPHASAHLEYSLDSFDADDQYEIRQFVSAFVQDNHGDYVRYVATREARGDAPRMAHETFGHDLLLTRSGHGAGFWDRGLGELGDRLTEAAKVYGDTSVEVRDGGVLLIES